VRVPCSLGPNYGLVGFAAHVIDALRKVVVHASCEGTRKWREPHVRFVSSQSDRIQITQGGGETPPDKPPQKWVT